MPMVDYKRKTRYDILCTQQKRLGSLVFRNIEDLNLED